MTRDTKDTLIVTNCGAEAIAFLKVYGVVPAAAGFMIWYSTLTQHLSKRKCFYATIVPFFAWFGLFAFVAYPMRGVLHASAGKEAGLSYVVNLGRYWLFSLYYVVAEIWGSAGVPLLFWQTANEVTSIPQVGPGRRRPSPGQAVLPAVRAGGQPGAHRLGHDHEARHPPPRRRGPRGRLRAQPEGADGGDAGGGRAGDVPVRLRAQPARAGAAQDPRPRPGPHDLDALPRLPEGDPRRGPPTARSTSR
ncbi:unnamed protein product, partial [Heterosigma akashiwo]